MSGEDQVTAPAQAAEVSEAQDLKDLKGKGKSTEAEPNPVVDDEDDEESEEDQEEPAAEEEEEDEDNLEEIDQENIISDGRRTRGKAIDFAKAAEGLDDEDMDEDEEEDEDFEDPDDSMTG